MSQAEVAGSARYVVSASTVVDRKASQLYFAALLGQRPLVGGSLGLALRRLRTIAGPEEFDHLRIAHYPHSRALAVARCSPLLPLLTPLRRRGVAVLRVSEAAVTRAPDDWRAVRAAWVLTDTDHTASAELQEALGTYPELGATCAFEASLSALAPHPLRGTSPLPLPARSLSVLAFQNVRLALDALALPEVRTVMDRVRQRDASRQPLGWALMERVSLREMLTPA